MCRFLRVLSNVTVRPNPASTRKPLYNKMPKINDLLSARQPGSDPPYAFEFYPPRTEAGVTKLYDRLESMAKADPLYGECGGETTIHIYSSRIQ